MLDMQEQSRYLSHMPPVKMSKVIKACTDSGGEVILADDQSKKSRQRQQHFRDQVFACRRKVTRLGRGVLVLIGSDHLQDMNDSRATWNALHEIVYSGLSFIHGRYGSCLMIWQLS